MQNDASPRIAKSVSRFLDQYFGNRIISHHFSHPSHVIRIFREHPTSVIRIFVSGNTSNTECTCAICKILGFQIFCHISDCKLPLCDVTFGFIFHSAPHAFRYCLRSHPWGKFVIQLSFLFCGKCCNQRLVSFLYQIQIYSVLFRPFTELFLCKDNAFFIWDTRYNVFTYAKHFVK